MDLLVTEEHVKHVAVMSLRHRLRRDPLDESSSDTRVKKMILKYLIRKSLVIAKYTLKIFSVCST